MAERLNIDEQGRRIQDVYGAFPAPAPARGTEQWEPTALSGDVHDGGPAPVAAVAAEPEHPEPEHETVEAGKLRAFDGGAPRD